MRTLTDNDASLAMHKTHCVAGLEHWREPFWYKILHNNLDHGNLQLIRCCQRAAVEWDHRFVVVEPDDLLYCQVLTLMHDSMYENHYLPIKGWKDWIPHVKGKEAHLVKGLCDDTLLRMGRLSIAMEEDGVIPIAKIDGKIIGGIS